MEQEPAGSSAGEMMVFGLIEQADRIGKSAQGTQRVLTEQIEELVQLKQWAVSAAVDLQKRAEASAVALKQQAEAVVESLEVERAQLQGVQNHLARNAVQAVHDAVRQQSDEIGRQTVQALAQPLHDIQQAATQVRQNVRNSNWMFTGGIFVAGIVIGLLAGYFFVMRAQNRMGDQLDRMEQSLSVPVQPAQAMVDPHAATHKGKGK